MTHSEISKLIDKYHAKAAELYVNTNIHVSTIKNVQLNEDGAFVEAMIWISKSQLSS